MGANTDMFTIDTAMGLLVALRPELTEVERNKWRSKGSDAILAEVNRIKKVNELTVDQLVEEALNVPATGSVAKKNK